MVIRMVLVRIFPLFPEAGVGVHSQHRGSWATWMKIGYLSKNQGTLKKKEGCMDVECITKSGHSSNPLLFLVLVEIYFFFLSLSW